MDETRMPDVSVEISMADPAHLERAVRVFTGAGGGRVFAQSPGTVALIAYKEGQIVGWCWGYHLHRPDDTSMLYLHHLEVAEKHRRSGIGRELLRAFITAGAQAGARKMFLTTGEANRAARCLYESMGGRPAAQGPTVNYWFSLHPDVLAEPAPRADIGRAPPATDRRGHADAVDRPRADPA